MTSPFELNVTYLLILCSEGGIITTLQLATQQTAINQQLSQIAV